VSHVWCAVYVGSLTISWSSGGEGAEDPCHHDAVQSSPIDERIGDVGEDVVVEGVATKREKHEITPPLVVG
jgi:hypothetical protein